jgi:hypothetical protein
MLELVNLPTQILEFVLFFLLVRVIGGNGWRRRSHGGCGGDKKRDKNQATAWHVAGSVNVLKPFQTVLVTGQIKVMTGWPVMSSG